MAFELKQKPFQFSDGRQIVVHESNWITSNKRANLEQQARKDRARLNGSGDKALLDFQEEIYPLLAAPSSGDVPDLQVAFEMPDEDLDQWSDAVYELNPHLFVEKQDIQPKEIVFRDGSKLTVVSSQQLSTVRRLMRLRAQLAAYIDQDVTFSEFALYPAMAACSRGDVPTLEEARYWPEIELGKWLSAAKEMNPGLFMQPMAAEELDPVAEKKRKRRRAR